MVGTAVQERKKKLLTGLEDLGEFSQIHADWFHVSIDDFKDNTSARLSMKNLTKCLKKVRKSAEKLGESLDADGKLDLGTIEKRVGEVGSVLAMITYMASHPIPTSSLKEAIQDDPERKTALEELFKDAARETKNVHKALEALLRDGTEYINSRHVDLRKSHRNDDDYEPPAKKSKQSRRNEDRDSNYSLELQDLEFENDDFNRTGNPRDALEDRNDEEESGDSEHEGEDMEEEKEEPKVGEDEEQDEEVSSVKNVVRGPSSTTGNTKTNWFIDASMAAEIRSRKPKDEQDKAALKALLDPIEARLEEPNVSERVEFNEPDVHFTNLKEILNRLRNSIVTRNSDFPISSTHLKKATSNGSFPPQLLFTTTLKVDPAIVTGAEIVRLAQRWKTSGVNDVYDSDSFRYAEYKENQTSINDDYFQRKYFDAKYGDVRGSVLKMVASDGWRELEKEGDQLSSFILESTSKMFGVSLSPFSRDTILVVIPDQECNVLHQRAQRSTRNLWLYSKKTESDPHKGAWPWKDSGHISTHMPVKEVITNQIHRETLIQKGVDDCKKYPNKKTEILEDLEEKIIKSGIDHTKYLKDGDNRKKRMVPPSVLLSSFATNLDFTDLTKFKEQEEMISKLWEWMQPGKRLLVHMKNKHAGINCVQAYVKEAGSRTTAHQENQLLGSINWNMGPGECVWLIVPMAYAEKFDALMRKKNMWPFASPYWPDEKELLENGISFQKCVQGPGELIYVGVGSYHWVQANGPCINIAWNVGEVTSTQLLASALNFDQTAEQKYRAIVPVEAMLWELAKTKTQPADDDKFWLVAKSFLCRSLAKCQFEWDYAKGKTGWENKLQRLDMNITSCQNDKCHESLFNMFVIKTDKEGVKARCLKCSRQYKNDFQVCYRYEIGELVKIFDDYIQLIPPNSAN